MVCLKLALWIGGLGQLKGKRAVTNPAWTPPSSTVFPALGGPGDPRSLDSTLNLQHGLLSGAMLDSEDS